MSFIEEFFIITFFLKRKIIIIIQSSCSEKTVYIVIKTTDFTRKYLQYGQLCKLPPKKKERRIIEYLYAKGAR